VNLLCEIAKVSRSGYYKYLTSNNSLNDDTETIRRIKIAQDEVRFTYGAKRMARQLTSAGGRPCNHKRVARIMRENMLNSRIRRKTHPDYYYRQKRLGYKVTDLRLAPNVLNREFAADAPVKKLVTDITVIPCTDGWLYLSAVMDLYNKEILVHRFSLNADTALVVQTIKGIASRFDVHGVLIHSDKGPTYRSYEYQNLLTSLCMVPSFSRTGNCWDNAAMESFFGHMKCEIGYANCRIKKPASERAIEYIDNYMIFYNERRIQQGLGYRSPVAFRNKVALVAGK
jgi:putative transposase